MNPMWLDPEEVEREEIKFRNKRLFERLDRELEGDQEKGVSEEEREKRRDKSELDYLRGRSETVVELDEEREEREDEERTKDEERRVRKEREGQEEQETQNWFAMDVSFKIPCPSPLLSAADDGFVFFILTGKHKISSHPVVSPTSLSVSYILNFAPLSRNDR